MKIKMLVSMAGPDLVLSPGDEHECEAAEAQRLIDAGYAELVRGAPIERATARPKGEKAVK